MALLALRVQASASVDLGASAVRYDGFLLSGAAAISPAIWWNGSRGTVAARGTYLRFESGHRSVQGSIAGSVFTAPKSGWRLESTAGLGASAYADFASFWHAIAELRVHHDGTLGGVWLAGAGGRTSFGSTFPSRPVWTASANGWRRRGSLIALMSLSRAVVGDTQYSDITVTAHGQYRSFVLESNVGARFWSRGGGRGVYGEASGVLPLRGRLALVLAGGRYPTDPVRGSIAGRYGSVSLRLQLRSSVAGALPSIHDPDASLQFRIRVGSDGRVALIIHAPEARVVELAGDFTDWQPVSLTRGAAGDWLALLPIVAGVHQINVRIDNGPWIAPSGTTRVLDDYGGQLGVFVVP